MGIFNFFNGRKKILEEKKIILEESKKRLKDESTGSDISSKNTDVKESNESITNKDSSEIRETNITKITHEFEWIDGFKIYDFEDFAKNQSDLLNATNVPMYFKLPDEDEGSIIITVPTENIGNSIIDQVINKNGSHISFRSTEQDEWTNLYKGYEFVIGYFPERDHVRINQLP